MTIPRFTATLTNVKYGLLVTLRAAQWAWLFNTQTVQTFSFRVLSKSLGRQELQFFVNAVAKFFFHEKSSETLHKVLLFLQINNKKMRRDWKTEYCISHGYRSQALFQPYKEVQSTKSQVKALQVCSMMTSWLQLCLSLTVARILANLIKHCSSLFFFSFPNYVWKNTYMHVVLMQNYFCSQSKGQSYWKHFPLATFKMPTKFIPYFRDKELLWILRKH